MMLYLSALPLWVSGLVLVGLPTILGTLGPVFVRRRIPLDRLSTNNEVAGFKFATVGVIYAVLIAFAVIVVWEKFSDADSAVAREAGAVAGLYRLANGAGGDEGEAIRSRLTAYLHAAINDDWPAMARGEASPAATQALNAMYTAVLSLSPRDARETVIMSETLHQLDLVTQARRTRIVLAAGIVPSIVWTVLLAGAVLTISFTFFFGTENLRAQSLMAGLLSAIIFMGLLVIVSIDHLYTGDVRVTPEALAQVLRDFSAGP